MLVANPATHDTRVIKEAETLAAAGYRVDVIAAQEGGLVPLCERNGVRYHRLVLPRRDFFWEIFLDGLRGPRTFRCAYAFAAMIIFPFLPVVLARRQQRLVDFLKRARAEVDATPRKVEAAPAVVATGQGGHPLPARPSLWRTAFGRLIRIASLPYTYTLAKLLLPLANADRYDRLMRPAVTSLKPDAIHAHDLDTLVAGVRAGDELDVPVVYDAHELETDRNDRASWTMKLLARFIERAALRRVARAVTVSPGIAAHMARNYGIAEPVVVLNSPRLVLASQPSQALRESLSLPRDTPLAAYVGLVTCDRCLDEMVEALVHAPLFHLALVGPAVPAVVDELRQRASALGVANRLHVVPPVAPDAVPQFVSSADVGVITARPLCLSYEYSLPNKLFEMSLAGLPLVVAELQSMKEYVEKNGIGVAVDSGDPRAIAQGWCAVLERRSFRLSPPDLERLRLQYGWEVQGARLIALYQELPMSASPAASPAHAD